MTDETSQALASALAPRLALLRAVATEGHLTRAAERLGIPQPTVSRWLAALADELGTPVLLRDGRGVRLSRAGEYLADAAGRALTVLESGCRRVVEEVDPERGQVVLAFLHTMGESRVPLLLRAFRRERPQVRFTLLQGAQDEVLDRVRSGRADLALTSPLPDPEEFEYARLDEQPLVVAVPAGHRFADRDRITLAELAGETFVGMSPGHGLRQMTDELCAAAGFTPELAFEGEEADTVRGLVAAGLGVAVLPVAERWATEDNPTGTPRGWPGLLELPLTPHASRQIGLVWAANRPLAPAARAFRQFTMRHSQS